MKKRGFGIGLLVVLVMVALSVGFLVGRACATPEHNEEPRSKLGIGAEVSYYYPIAKKMREIYAF